MLTMVAIHAEKMKEYWALCKNSVKEMEIPEEVKNELLERLEAIREQANLNWRTLSRNKLIYRK